MRTSAGGMAVALGLFSNARYQIIGGMDRYLFERSNYLWSYLSFSTLFRAVSAFIGEPTRRHLQVRGKTNLLQELLCLSLWWLFCWWCSPSAACCMF